MMFLLVMAISIAMLFSRGYYGNIFQLLLDQANIGHGLDDHPLVFWSHRWKIPAFPTPPWATWISLRGVSRHVWFSSKTDGGETTQVVGGTPVLIHKNRWVNFITTSLRSHWKSWLGFGNHPLLWP